MSLSIVAIKINAEKRDKKGPDASMLRLYVPDEELLPQTPTFCCCSVPAWGWFSLISSVLGFAIKYFLFGGDGDIDMIFELLTIPKWYETLLVPFGIYNFLALLGLAMGLIVKQSKYTAAYLVWQISLTFCQTLLAIVYTGLILIEKMEVIKLTVDRCIIGFFTLGEQTEHQMLALDDLTKAKIVVAGVFGQALLNGFYAYLAIQLYKCYRVNPANNRFRR